MPARDMGLLSKARLRSRERNPGPGALQGGAASGRQPLPKQQRQQGSGSRPQFPGLGKWTPGNKPRGAAILLVTRLGNFSVFRARLMMALLPDKVWSQARLEGD
jgi:hypothetical protein